MPVFDLPDKGDVWVKKNSGKDLVDCFNAYFGERKIIAPKGTYELNFNTGPIVVNADSGEFEGRGWDTIIQPQEAMDSIIFNLAGSATALMNTRLRNFMIDQNYKSGNAITNLQTGTTFTAGADRSINHALFEGIKVIKVNSTKYAMGFRNLDNRCVFRHNYFTAISGEDVYVEANGRAGGQATFIYNWFSHGNCEAPIHLYGHQTNIRRTTIRDNTFVSTDAANTRTAIIVEIDSATHPTPIIDFINIHGNTFEDFWSAIDIGGSLNGVVNNVHMFNNHFFNRSAEANQVAVRLRTNARRCRVVNNDFTSVGNIGLIGILDLNITAGTGNIIQPNDYTGFSGTDGNYTKSAESLQLSVAPAT